MGGSKGRETPRAAYGCLAMAIIAVVAAAALSIVFLWDVNTG